jgi:hypothetical protein
LLFALINLFVPVPAQTQGGLALSGNFYRQEYEIPQGSSVSSPEIYVVVFNTGEADLGVKMTTQSPVGVRINLSQNDFTLPPGGQQMVLVGVEVTKDAAPGEYELTVTAESYKKGGTGIQISGAAGQSAKLTVLGESGSVKVQAVSPEGQPLVSTVRLYRVMASQNYEVAFSETGTLEAKVAPGSFIAATYIGGEKRAEESFSVAAGDNKTITLSAATIYFEGFGIVPNYQKESGKLAFAQIVYTVRNLYKQVTRAEVILEVSRDGAKLEEIQLATLSPLDIGRAGLNYNYMPSGGWTNGVYSFKLVLKLDGEPYATSFDEAFDVTTSVVPTRGINLVVFSGGIIAGVALITFCVGLFILRKHRV